MFDLTEPQKMMEKMLRTYVDKEIMPHIPKMDKGEMLPYDLYRKMYKDLGMRGQVEGAVAKQIAAKRKVEAGEAPPAKKKPDDDEEGGLMGGNDPVLGMIFMKELGRASPGFAMSLGASIGLCGLNILNKGSADQVEQYAKPVMLLDKIGSWGLTEPGAGSDAFGSMKTTARRDGDYWVLNGSKTFITNAPFADVFVIYAKLNKGQGGDIRGWPVKSFIVTRQDAGLSTSKPMEKMGMCDSPTGLVYLEDCRIPANRMMGSENEEARAGGKQILEGERSGLPALAVGIMERCIEVAVKYAKEREQFGQPIANYQAVQLRIANMYIAYENAKNLLFKQAWLQKEGKRDMFSACVCKVYCSQMATQVALDAIQILGGNGYMKEYHVEKLMRDAKLLEIGGGTSDINLMTMARELLK
ncbi:MAG: acyl-CoA dehydrogenase family protein [Bdellovibrionota bacterium]